MTLLRGLADDLPLDRWLTEHIFPAEAKNVSPEFVYDGTLLAALEMIEGGTTTFADMYYFESDAARAVDKAGLRGVLGETFIDFPVPDHKDLPATLAYMKQFVETLEGHTRGSRRRSLRTRPTRAPRRRCSRRGTWRLPRTDPAPDSRRRDAQGAATTRAKDWQQSPFLRLASDRILRSGAGGSAFRSSPRTACGWTRRTWRSPKQYGVSLSHNPESNMKLASGIADVTAWQKAGLVWGLGTDGAAGSNNDLSMFEAMDFAGKLAKVSKSDPTALPARDLVAAATRGGAKTLGLDASIGSLEPGKQADFIAIDVGTTAHDDPFPGSRIRRSSTRSRRRTSPTSGWTAGACSPAENRRLSTFRRSSAKPANGGGGSTLSLAPKAARLELGKEALREIGLRDPPRQAGREGALAAKRSSS